METTRRGFLGLLAGLILGGKVLGPRILQPPTPTLWRHARDLPRLPIENSYIPLEIMASDVLRIIHEETEWLRLRREVVASNCAHWRGRLLGHTTMMRPPVRFEPQIDIDWSKRPLIVERVVPVTLQYRAQSPVYSADPKLWAMPLEEVRSGYIIPMGRYMAEEVISAVRSRQGGAGLLVAGAQNSHHDVDRSVVVTNEDLGLSVRASCWQEPCGGRKNFCRDMVYGLA